MTARTEGETAGPEKLFPEFTAQTPAEWHAAALELLKGKPFDKVMLTPTLEGITLRPIYHSEDVEGLPHLADEPGLGSLARGSFPQGYLGGNWEISQELPYGTPEEFNRVALMDLARGQSELNILLDLAGRSGRDPDAAEPGEVGACGLSVANLGDLARAFRDIRLEMISLYIRCGSSGLPFASLLIAYARRSGVNLKEMRGCIEIDPLSSLARLGAISVSMEQAYEEMAMLTAFAAESAPNLQTIGVQGHSYHDGGASATEELGCALATAAAYFRAMGERGLDADAVAPRMRLALSIGGDFFMELAKFRAARLLWSRVATAFGASPEAARPFIHARTGLYNKTARDPYVNMLRTTTEAFAAALGGVQSMHVSPFDEVFSVPTDFSRRIARNQQIILQEECELTKTIDPAGGSWYVEWLTDQIASKAWDVFQEIEKSGGMLAALEAGLPQKRIASTASQRDKLVQQRRKIVVGVNQYPNASEKAALVSVPDYREIHRQRAEAIESFRQSAPEGTDDRVLQRLQTLADASNAGKIEAAVAAAAEGASLGEISRALRHGMGGRALISEHIPLRRASAAFEELRDAAERFEANTGRRPLIFQANLGPSRTYRLRADWTSAFFQTAGIEVLAENDFETPEAAANAAADSGAGIVVLVSTDERYPEVVEPTARLLKSSQRRPFVIVAGAPEGQETAWREAGVDDFVHVRVNNYTFNRMLLEKLGVL